MVNSRSPDKAEFGPFTLLGSLSNDDDYGDDEPDA